MQSAIKFLTKVLFVEKIVDYFNPNKIRLRPEYQKRAYIMGAVFAAFAVFILLRYAWISFFPTHLREHLISAGTKQVESTIILTQPRAIVTDRNGQPLAVSVPTTSVFILPRKMPKDPAILQSVAKRLGVNPDELAKYVKQKKKFVWLKRQLTRAEMEKIGSLKNWNEFIGTADEPKRIYPEKDLAAQLIGFVGSDGNGLEGVEKIYNERLRAIPTKAEVRRDARGNYVIATPSIASKPDQLAENFTLSIDITIQDIAQTALRNGVLNAKARGGSAVVMDITTGEVLALASYPTYDLNNPPENNPSARRFRPVMDAIELGSVVKPMWIAKALDLGVITPQSKIYAEMGQMQLSGGVIHDTHPHGWLTPEEILKFSSNIGTFKVVQKLGKDEFYSALMKIGFGRAPGSGLPGEWSGKIQPIKTWRDMRFANMAFGQGFAISALQLAHGLSILAGGGVDRGVHLLKFNSNEVSEEVGPPLRYVSEKTSKQIVKMLESVVEEPGGTGSLARIPGILVAGKTGTAQIWSQKTKSYSERTPVFEGVLPAQNPKLAIVVVLDEAQVRPAMGGPLAGPVFAEIGKKTLNYLNSRGLFSFDSYENQYLNNTNTNTSKSAP